MKRICIAVCTCAALSSARGMNFSDDVPGIDGSTSTEATHASARLYAGDNPSLRERMVVDAARTEGFRIGLAERGAALTRALENRVAALNAIYPFVTLVDKDGFLPPVVVEARDVTHITPEQVRSAGRVYRIERDARFVSVPPTWRDYLMTGLSAPPAEKSSFGSTMPTPTDSVVARRATAAGEREGRAQADAILAANFNRMNRDFTGMLRYADLLRQGVISQPVVSEAVQSVTGDSEQVMVNDRLRRLIAHARLQPDGDKWRPVIVVEQPAGGGPEADSAPPSPAPALP